MVMVTTTEPTDMDMRPPAYCLAKNLVGFTWGGCARTNLRVRVLRTRPNGGPVDVVTADLADAGTMLTLDLANLDLFPDVLTECPDGDGERVDTWRGTKATMLASGADAATVRQVEADLIQHGTARWGTDTCYLTFNLVG